jgi:hypothetical protein
MIAETIFFTVEMRPIRTRFYHDHEQGRPRGRALAFPGSASAPGHPLFRKMPDMCCQHVPGVRASIAQSGGSGSPATGHSPNELVWLWRFWATQVKRKLGARPAGYSHGHVRYSAHLALVCYPVPPHIQDVGSRKSELCSALAFRPAKFTVRLKSVPTVTDHETISACIKAIFTKSL